jgi:hypothetical protein
MSIHNWTKAPGGYFHHFHQNWTIAICAALNRGLLPKGVFAMVEKYSGAVEADVLALETRPGFHPDRFEARGGAALLTEPPKARFVSKTAEESSYAARANVVSIRRGDATIAMIEVVSPGNKSSVLATRQFVEKSVKVLSRGVHLLVVDLFPPTSRDPEGLHGVIWGQLGDDSFVIPADKQLTFASYVAGEPITAYVDPAAVEDDLPDMPLFLDSKTYIRVPLNSTYEDTWRQCPEEFKQRVAPHAE